VPGPGSAFRQLPNSTRLITTLTEQSPPPSPAESPLFEQPPSYDARVRLLFWGARWQEGTPEVEDVTAKFDHAGRFDRVGAADILDMVPSPSLAGMRFRYNSDGGLASWGEYEQLGHVRAQCDCLVRGTGTARREVGQGDNAKTLSWFRPGPRSGVSPGGSAGATWATWGHALLWLFALLSDCRQAPSGSTIASFLGRSHLSLCAPHISCIQTMLTLLRRRPLRAKSVPQALQPADCTPAPHLAAPPPLRHRRRASLARHCARQAGSPMGTRPG
jgi:hypothetical protein